VQVVKVVRRRLARVLAALAVPVAVLGAPRKWS
jgi:hypothetical protein